MKMHHRPHHWIAVAVVLAALLLALNEAHGQSTGAAAAFEGRPAMAGAQGGLGAQAGPPQGGIGVQGADKGTRPAAMTGAAGAAANAIAAPASDDLAKDTRPRKDVKPGRDQGLAKDERSAAKKAKRAAKRTISRSRHGVGPIDSGGKTAP